jgi:transcriptional regulator with XRE-family HTH domain
MCAAKKGPEATIGGRIAQARFSLAARLGRNVTQAWLAEQAGVSGPTVSQWESGVTEPTITSIAKIAAALGTSPGWLAWGEETTYRAVAEPAPAFQDAPPAAFERIPTKAEREAAAKKKRA